MAGRAKRAAAPNKKANGYKMPAPIAIGEVIHNRTMKKKWRIGPSIGVGGFGEIYSACDHESNPEDSNYPFVIKIEPRDNGPLFVEKHFYIRNAKMDDIRSFMRIMKLSSLGMPSYYGNGTHVYKGEKYGYIVLERYGRDLWSLFAECGRMFPPATVFQIGLQMLDVLEYIHNRNYVHADIKGANILLGLKKGTENQAYLVDFGLARRINHKQFKPDPKCAHNGTIEYTSRDAHLGVPTMRGDLEILGYNMLQWLCGTLPWEKCLYRPETVQQMKEDFMKSARNNITKLSNSVPDSLIKFFEYINTLKPKEVPDYAKCRQIVETYLKSQGVTRNCKLVFTPSKITKRSTKTVTVDDDDDEVPLKKSRKKADAKVVKKRTPKTKETAEENGENEEPEETQTKKKAKRKSAEPSVLVKVKKPKLAPKATPPVKKNHANIATQTSLEKRRSPRQVSFESPISLITEEEKSLNRSKENEPKNTSADMFKDSVEDKKPKKKVRLLSDEEYVETRVVKTKVTSVMPTTVRTRSWKDTPTVMNGQSPPK